MIIAIKGCEWFLLLSKLRSARWARIVAAGEVQRLSGALRLDRCLVAAGLHNALFKPWCRWLGQRLRRWRFIALTSGEEWEVRWWTWSTEALFVVRLTSNVNGRLILVRCLNVDWLRWRWTLLLSSIRVFFITRTAVVESPVARRRVLVIGAHFFSMSASFSFSS